MPNVQLVNGGKPQVSGSVWVAPTGTSLPTSTSATLAAAFEDLGYISEDGVTNTPTRESDSVTAWGGDTVMDMQTSFTDQYQFTLIESTNIDAKKLVFGKSNVSGTLATGLTTNVNGKELDEWSIVIDTLLRDGGIKRQVLPKCKVVEVGDIVYNNSDPVGYEVTINAYPDSSGNTHYEYEKSATTSA